MMLVSHEVRCNGMITIMPPSHDVSVGRYKDPYLKKHVDNDVARGIMGLKSIGYSNQSIADELGIKRLSISQWICDGVRPKKENIIKLNELFKKENICMILN